MPREYWEKLVAEAGYGPSLRLKDCSWPYVLLMRLGVYLLEILVHSVKVPRNTLKPRLESRLIPVLYHIYSFRSSWQVSLAPGGSPLWGLLRGPFPPRCLSFSEAPRSVWVRHLLTDHALPGFPLLLSLTSRILSPRSG